MKKNKLQMFLVISAVFIALVLLNRLSSMKPPGEKVTELISQHRGAIILVKSGDSRKDDEFLNIVKEIRPRLKGTAGIVVTDKKSGYAQEGEELPLLIILDAHGSLLQRFPGDIDEKLLSDAVHAIVTHAH